MDKTKSILITDDNPENIKVLFDMLKNEGYKIRIATNGEQAVKSVNTEVPGLILMDIQMPQMDGYEACRRIKVSKENKSVPIIFMSAMTETYNIVEAFRAGGVDYITKPFQLEEVLARVNTHFTLREKTIELESALKKLSNSQSQLIQSEKMASIGQLTAGIAHELNNPLNFINVGAIGLKKDIEDLLRLLDEYQKLNGVKDLSKKLQQIKEFQEEIDYEYLRTGIPEILTDIMEGTQRTVDIVRGLRNFSRIDSEDKQLADIHEGLENTLKLLQNKFKNKVTLTKEYDESIGEIYCYPGQLNQVFMNLLANEEQAIKDKGEVVVTTKDLGKSILISIKDDGRGIPKDNKERIFDPFFTTKDVGEGTGLGLSIAYGIIDKHGGKIEVESEEGKGTEFVIRLPKRSS